jgi:DUF218 domain
MVLSPYELAARKILDFLSLRDPLQPADLIMGFGHFDMNIPKHCVQLYHKGYAEKILFTGGVGAGSIGLTQPEAKVFLDLAEIMEPGIRGDIYIEDQSTQTGENIQMSATLLRNLSPTFCFEKGIQRVILVTHPFRQRRVYETFHYQYPGLTLINHPPVETFEEQEWMYTQKGGDFIPWLKGEMDRLLDYPKAGYFSPVDLSVEIMEAYEILKEKPNG